METVIQLQNYVVFILLLPTIVGVIILSLWLKYYDNGEKFPQMWHLGILISILFFIIIFLIFSNNYLDKEAKDIYFNEIKNLKKAGTKVYIYNIDIENSDNWIKILENPKDAKKYKRHNRGNRFLTRLTPIELNVINKNHTLNLLISKDHLDSTIHMVELIKLNKTFEIGVIKTSDFDDYYYFGRFRQKEIDKEKELQKIYPYKYEN